MQEAVFITTKLSVLTKKADLSAVPDIFNPNYAIALDEEMEGSFYILKKDTGKSVLKMLDEREYYQIGEAAAVRVRNGYARLLRDVELCEAYRGNDAYRKMLRCFTEDDFSGIILCGMQVNIVNASAFASPQMVQGVIFEAPVLTVTGVRFDGGRVDVSAGELYGRVEGRTNLSFEDEEQMARCLIERVTALVCRSEVLYADIWCRVLFGRLFSAETVMEEGLFCGVYQQMAGAVSGVHAYVFANDGKTEIALKDSCLAAVALERITAKLETEKEKLQLRMECSGKLYFTRQPGDCDMFSYGKDLHDVRDCGLRYSGLVFCWELLANASRLEVDVANMDVSDKGCCARGGSFAGQMPHGRMGFCSWQSGCTPEEQQYRRILTPFPQKRLGNEWYGITMEVLLFQSVTLKLLFAFEHQNLYIGGKIEGNGGGSGLSIPAKGPFRIQVKSIVLDVGRAKGDICYGLILKGLKMSVFGMTMPSGSCNVLFAKDAQGNSSWYAVYGNRKEE